MRGMYHTEERIHADHPRTARGRAWTAQGLCGERHHPSGRREHRSLHCALPQGNARRHGRSDHPHNRYTYSYLRNLEARRQEVRSSIENQGKLTEELSRAIDEAKTLAEVEDIYRPYKQKRRTRATIAREKGLAPLAELLYAQAPDCPAPEEAAKEYVDEEKGVASVEEALAGASDIIAETISDDADVRKDLRTLYNEWADVVSVAAEKNPKDTVYRNYYAFTSPVNKIQGHQVLAVNRGEKEGVLKVGIVLSRDAALAGIYRRVLKKRCASTAFVENAAADAYDRLIAPSMEREVRAALTDTASEGAIGQFALNLKPLLMQPPVKGFVTMGLDPGYRMGCKVAVVDATGKVLDTTVVYPTHGEKQKRDCIEKLTALIRKDHVRHIAIGNGTASRETEAMTVELIAGLGKGAGVSYAIVNEAGASVYSASPLAAAEFPDFDVNLRSAVSIARRLQDPLAELVKIDPKSIGVGQYQHDMPEKRLTEALDGVVEDCVNAVGVDVNTASAPLLARVSGLNAGTAANVVKYREENGSFSSRQQLLKVPKLGAKAFEQCAGFLRVPESSEILDNTAVHPESYGAAEKTALHLRLHGGRRPQGQPLRTQSAHQGIRRREARKGMRRRRSHAARRRFRDPQTGPRPQRRAPCTHSPHRRARDQGLKTGHGTQGNGAQRHRLRRVRGHRRASGRARAYLADL